MGTIIEQAVIQGHIQKEHSRVYKRNIDFTDAASPDGLAETTLGEESGVLGRVSVLFGSPAPSSLVVTIKDVDGHQLLSENLTSSGSLEMDNNIPYVGGLTLTLSGNTTADAEALISFLSF